MPVIQKTQHGVCSYYEPLIYYRPRPVLSKQIIRRAAQNLSEYYTLVIQEEGSHLQAYHSLEDRVHVLQSYREIVWCNMFVKLFSTEIGEEYIFTSWSNGRPNNYNYGCACVDPNGNPPWSWTDCDCITQRQFVCLKSRQNMHVLHHAIT